MKKILFIFGTRPEAIKLAPIIKEFQKYPDDFDVKVCVTAQHRDMLDQVLIFFKVTPDYDLDLMKQKQSLFDITANALKSIESIIDATMPDIIFVQGDTTTAFVGALAGFYKKIKIAHIEAGLRTYNKYSPFPEEINRALISKIADYHFAPTKRAKKNLELEYIYKNIFTVGNTVIDALFSALNIIKEKENIYKNFFDFLDKNKKIILVTAHRRESFGKPLESICNALKSISKKFSEIQIVFPVHLNPNVREPVNRILNGVNDIYLTEPLSYPYLIWLLDKSYFVLTDSGGIQEEAAALNKPVLITREATERIEGVECGIAKVIGTDFNSIVSNVGLLITNSDEYNKMAQALNPYGDGTASERIKKIILNY